MTAQDQTIDVVIRWDHRITDAALIAKAMTRLEQVLNTEIAAEIRGQQAAGRTKAGPGRRDLTPERRNRPFIADFGLKNRPFILTGWMVSP